METEKPPLLDRDDWLAVAYEAFESKGIEAVRIEPLSKSLGVTRGSFYWHFKNRADLLRAVLERWCVLQTEAVIVQNEAAGGDARTKLLRLFETCAGDEGKLEMSIRLWMTKDAQAREIVARVDACRIQYISTLLEQTGLAPEQADRRAPVAYASWLGDYSGAVPADQGQRLRNMRTLFELIVAA